MKCLVTAIGSMSAEAVIQAIVRQPGTVVIGCNTYPREWLAASRLIERFYQVPSARDEVAYLHRIREICEIEKISHVIPLTDPEVDVLSENRRWFDGTGVCLCISPQLAIGLARDKLAVHQLFAGHSRIRPIPTVRLDDERHHGFAYPLLAKPRHGRSSEGHVSIPDAAALRFWRGRLAGQEYVVQPRCDGPVYVVDVVRQPGGPAVAMTREELLRTPNGAGMTVRMQPGHVCDLLATEAAELLDLLGCINMEFLLVDDLPLLMDVNPRFSAGVAFSLMAGYDMVLNHLRCFDGGQVELCSPPPPKVYARGLFEYSLD